MENIPQFLDVQASDPEARAVRFDAFSLALTTHALLRSVAWIRAAL